MKQVNLHEAKTHLSRLVAENVPFRIARSGKPVMEVRPISEDAPRRIGFLAGYVSVPPDFDTMGADEIAEMFEQGGRHEPSA